MPRLSADQVLQQIRERIDYLAVYREFCGELIPEGRGWHKTICKFHEDNRPSMGCHESHGGFNCVACHASGDFIDFYKHVRSVNFVEAVTELAQRVGIEWSAEPADETRTIDHAIVDSAHERLKATPAAMDFLSTERGLTEQIIDEFKLGHDGQRYYIPIHEPTTGDYVNIRRYDPRSRAQNKMISWRTGFGAARLWPQESVLAGDTIYLMEGEMDALLGRSLGLNAMTCTGGAGTWRDPWSVMFVGLNVVICYDADNAGRAGAVAVARKLHGRAATVKIVEIPLPEIRGADFTDYIVAHGHTVQDFLSLVGQTSEFVPSDVPDDMEPVNREPVTVHLSQASLADYDNATITTPVVVSGKTHAPYIIPSQVEARCGMPGVRMCERCPVAGHAGRLVYDLSIDTRPVALKLLGVSEERQGKELRNMIGIPTRCTYVEMTRTSSANVEEIQVIPEVAESDEEAPYVTRSAYYQGHGLQANQGYVMTGVTLPHPANQASTHIIRDAVPSRSNLDAFELTESVVEDLKTFQPDGSGFESLMAKLNEVYADLEHITRIYHRRDIMTAVDLVYHSVLQFDFQGERLRRGWCEAFIIGDSRTGKSTIVERLRDHYRAGELSSGENTSLAGLVGGLSQIGTTWTLQWGKVPLNDRRLLVVDEAGNLPPEQIAKLSSMRSSGVAEIVKVHTEKTNARTRMIWIANPRDDRSLSSYSQGVVAVKELIGAPEDVARFDLFCTALSSDVGLATINAAHDHSGERVYASRLCHQRVMWAWSRRADQVQFTDDAVQSVLHYATIQGERYRHCAEIPLVEPNEQRVKIARLSVSAACMFFSTDETGEQVVVKPEHVEFSYRFLEQLFSKPSLAFAEWADARHRENTLRNTSQVQGILGTDRNVPLQLMQEEYLSQRSLKEILGVDDNDTMRSNVTALVTAGFLSRHGGRYRKTPAAIRWLRERISGTDADAMDMFGSSDEPPF